MSCWPSISSVALISDPFGPGAVFSTRTFLKID
jgi:hypothetical protein